MAQVDDEFARAAQVPSAAGHRERLRKRLLSGGAEALAAAAIDLMPAKGG